MGAACIGIGPLRHRVAALVAVARRHEFLDPLSHVCRAGSNLNSLFLIIKWLPAAGYIATSRPWSGGALTGPPGPVQAYFESQQPHGSLSVLPNWPWSRPSQPAMSAKNFTSGHDLPEYGVVGDRHPMRSPYGYLSNWAYARTRARNRGCLQNIDIFWLN